MLRTIASKLYLSFLAMAAVIVASAVFILYDIEAARHQRESLNENAQGAVLLARTQNATWELRFGLARLTDNSETWNAARTAFSHWNQETAAALDTFARMHTEDEERRLIEVLRAAYKAYAEAVSTHLGAQAAQAPAAADWYTKVAMPHGTAMLAALDELIAFQEQEGNATNAAIAASAERNRYFVIGFVIAAVAAAFATAFLITRSIVTPLRRMIAITEGVSRGDFTRRMGLQRADEFGTLAEAFDHMSGALTRLVAQVQDSSQKVNMSVMQIAGTAQQQQATATEIAATTTEIGATSREISATSKELVKTMNQVADVAEESAQLAGSGQTGLAHMEDTMRQVMDAAASINAKLAVLNEKAGNINRVVTTITKVADQTNLLSLNAAIEAEKAGEYGRGFAVVATEIRRLADQTAVATYDIEQMVKDIQSAVAAGVMGMDKFSEEVRQGIQQVREVGGQLSQIIQQVQALAPRVESVNEGMQAQSTGAEQISHALTQLTEAAQQTVESLSQSNRAIGELNEVAKGLRDGTSRFRLVA
jgi:methyl-accepting chemotaxis protein WspA